VTALRGSGSSLETNRLAAGPQRESQHARSAGANANALKKGISATPAMKKVLRRRVHVLFFAAIHRRDCTSARSQPLNIEE
jgi:hypothetical protein